MKDFYKKTVEETSGSIKFAKELVNCLLNEFANSGSVDNEDRNLSESSRNNRKARLFFKYH